MVGLVVTPSIGYRSRLCETCSRLAESNIYCMTMIEVLSRHPDAELVAICDKYKPLLDKCQKQLDQHGVHAALYENFEDFFKHDATNLIK